MFRRFATRLRDFLVSPIHGDHFHAGVERRAVLHAHLAAADRYADPRCLTRFGYRCTSQNDEDGIIDEIFRRIGTTNRQFVEFGVETGVENNTLQLLLAGWGGLWIEANSSAVQTIRRNFAEPLAQQRLRVQEAFVTAEGIEELLQRGGVPAEPDLVSIDIDGNDYWVWKALAQFRPRVVVIEYNASLGRSARIVQPYDPRAVWDHASMAFGASLGALEVLGQEKGYALVGCNLTGLNAFLVRHDCVGDRFLAPYTSAQHFEPPRYGPTGAGHPTRWARFEQV
jgi:hypothetical protein